MLGIFLCEDNLNELNIISKIIQDIVMMEQFDMNFALATPDPHKVIAYVKNNQMTGLYFLDIDLKTDLTGLELAEKIREYDPRSYIVFITTHAEMSYLTFIYKVEALDFIIKTADTNLPAKIKQCLIKINERHMITNKGADRCFVFKVEDIVINVPFDKILFFETSTVIHKVVLHGIDRQIEFYSSIKSVEEKLDGRFYKCKASCIVNKDLIREIDLKKRLIYMSNGESCHASTRLLKGILQRSCKTETQ